MENRKRIETANVSPSSPYSNSIIDLFLRRAGIILGMISVTPPIDIPSTLPPSLPPCLSAISCLVSSLPTSKFLPHSRLAFLGAGIFFSTLTYDSFDSWTNMLRQNCLFRICLIGGTHFESREFNRRECTKLPCGD